MNVDKTFINKLPDKYKQNILKAIEILKKYKIKEIYIFGSLAKEKYREDSDIDIAVRGSKNEQYYSIVGDLYENLNTDFDLIDLDCDDQRFVKLLLKEGSLVRVE